VSNTTEFGGWPRPPPWVWAIAAVATVAVLAGVIVARTGLHRAMPTSAGSGRLVADAGLQDAWQVAEWRPGDTRLYVAITRPPADTWPVAGPGPY
jgi:anti-sigma-K factor RskA